MPIAATQLKTAAFFCRFKNWQYTRARRSGLKGVALDPLSALRMAANWPIRLAALGRPRPSAPDPAGPDEPTPSAGVHLTVYAASQGGLFARELRQGLLAALLESGVEARPGDETSYPPPPGRRAVVIAPDLFFGRENRAGRPLPPSADLATHLFINTCCAAAPRFLNALGFLRWPRLFLQTDPGSAAVLKALGLRVRYFPPALARIAEGPLQRIDGIHVGSRVREHDVTGSWMERPLDVACFNASTPKAMGALSSLAPALSRRQSVLLHERWRLGEQAPGPEGELRGLSLAARARVVLQFRPGKDGYGVGSEGPWSAVLGGALLMSDADLGIPGLQAGRHYVACPVSRMPRALEWHLDTEAGRKESAAIIRAARDAPQADRLPARLVRSLLTAIRDLE